LGESDIEVVETVATFYHFLPGIHFRNCTQLFLNLDLQDFEDFKVADIISDDARSSL